MPSDPLAHASNYHAPVLVDEVLAVLGGSRGGLFLDGTIGGGGHTEALLESGAGVQVVGVDRDPDALAEAERRLGRFGERLRLVRANFADAVAAAGLADGCLTGVLLDLGVSSHQIDTSERGFTFRAGAPLDMRMGRGSAGEESAAEIIGSASAEELAEIFYRFGEEPRSRKLARILVEMRVKGSIDSSDHLMEAIGRTLGPRAEAQDRARIFQALRIAVNREIEALHDALPRFREALAPGGVLVVISYHSLEDRLVKNAFREWSLACVCPPKFPQCRCRGAPLGETLTRKPRSASTAEVQANPRARSAHLRAWRKG